MIKNENELSVSSKFDVKEQVFPRPLFVLSQEDEIHFLFKTYSEQDFLVNSIWISPNGNIHHVNRNSLVNATSGYLLDKVSPTTCKYDLFPLYEYLVIDHMCLTTNKKIRVYV